MISQYHGAGALSLKVFGGGAEPSMVPYTYLILKAEVCLPLAGRVVIQLALALSLNECGWGTMLEFNS